MKIRHGLVLIFAMAFGLSACAGGGATSGSTSPGPAAPVGELLRQGERPRQSDDTRAAQRALEEANQIADDAQAEVLFRQALASAEAAVAADSTNPLAHRLAAMASMGLDDYESADAYLTRAEDLRPVYTLETQGIREQAWIDLYQRAAPLVNSGAYEEAAEIFEMANHIYDQRPEVMLYLGQIYQQLGRYEESLANLDRAMEIINSDAAQERDSTTVAGWYEQAESVPLLRATVLENAGRFEEAADAYRGLVAEDPSDVTLSLYLASTLMRLEDDEEAFQVYDDLMSRPDLTSADYYSIGAGYYNGSDYTRAAGAFGEAAGLSVNDRDAIEMWARSLQLDSAFAEIPPVAERWVELDPNNRVGYLVLAQAVNLEGDDERTSELIRRIEALEVMVSDLQITRMRDGGARVNGSVTNITLAEGASVTMTFSFYDEAGAVLGTVDHTVAVGAAETVIPFTVEFASGSQVGGYGYTLSVG